MSYIPDYRTETDKLNEVDRAYIAGFRHAMECADTFYDNTDVYEPTEEEDKVLASARECHKEWMAMEEIECVYSLFNNADYLSKDIELKDAGISPFKKQEGE